MHPKLSTLVIDARLIKASGIGVYLKNIIPSLLDDFKITLLGDIEQLMQEEWSRRTQIISCQAPIYSIKEQLALRNKIPTCDLLWSPHYNIPLLPIKAKKRVVTIHDVYHLAYKHTLTSPQKLYSKLLLNAAVRVSDKIITVSNFSKSEIIKYTNARQELVHVVHNGVDRNRFANSNRKELSEAAKMQFPFLKKKFILFVGNVKPHKNLLTLLHAFNSLQEEFLDYYLVIVGKREGFITGDTQIAALIEQQEFLQKRVIFTGHVPDEILPSLYRAASLFVFPSFYEGFGLPPLEAMASGCPVVASCAASIPEICGDAAEYFDPHDPIALANTIYRVLNSVKVQEKLIENGSKQIRNFTWSKAAEKHLFLLKELA